MKKRFITQLILSLVVALIIGTVAFFFICKGLRQAKRDSMGKFNYLISDTTFYNTVFFGSSTTHADMNAALFDSVTGNRSYNAGMDGMEIADLNMLVHKYLKSHGAPRHIFISIDEMTLAMKRGVWYFPQYYPFVQDTDLKELVALEPKLLLGKYMPVAALTYFDDPLKNIAVIGLLKDNRKSEYDIPLQGFSPIFRRTDEEIKRIEVYYSTSTHGWELLEKTVAECRSRNIAVSILLPPRYNCFMSGSAAPVTEKLKYFESKYGSRILDYSTDRRFTSKNLFFDRAHLNAEGADLFTRILAKEVSATAEK